MESLCMESLKSHTKGRRMEEAMPEISLSAHQVPGYDDKHAAHKRFCLILPTAS